MSGNLRANLLKCSDKILSIREDMGAQLADVFIITRTWTGDRVGEGDFTDVSEKITPTPSIMDFSHDVRVTEAGAVKAGDLILTGVSLKLYPSEATLRTQTTAKNIQKMYKINSHYYHVVRIVERFVSWDIQLRKIRVDEAE